MIIKKFFNQIFQEEVKERLRMRFKYIFLCYDKFITRKSYLNAFKYIIKKGIKESKDYDYHTDNFLFRVRQEYVKYLVLNEYPSPDEEMKKCIDFIKTRNAEMLCYDSANRKRYTTEDIIFDETSGLYYANYVGKRLYLPRTMIPNEESVKFLNILAREQDDESPHKYISSSFRPEEGDVVFDIGCAEGNFALEVMDKVKKIYLFEVADEWMEALKLTMRPFGDKVQIIPKYVGSMDKENLTTLDHFCLQQNINQIDFLKMDVEGAEMEVLQGASRLISEGGIEKNSCLCLPSW